MFHTNKPRTEDLPTSKELLSSTKKALAVSLTILIIIVLPAEYGVDITGIWSLLWLKKMWEIKQSLIAEWKQADLIAKTPTPQQTAPTTPSQATPVEIPVTPPAGWEASMSVVVKPNGWAELKVSMKQGQKISYTWKVDGWSVNYNVHWESAIWWQTYEYTKWVQKNSFVGEIEAKFDGTHWWFFRNREKNDVTITVQVNWEFENLRQVE